ncbi:Putative methyltransferase associated with DUF414 [uncultured Candidatus Thioglobus sp.]|nr:Putative methyltransferase associated with DUF414 [uncultured Candidatus Thioglobus sp.]
MNNLCPLCDSSKTQPYFEDEKSAYAQCKVCDLVFMLPSYYLSEVDEKSRYDEHQNNPEDAKYRAFLSQVFNPVLARIKQGAKGLDFGSGPGPTLSLMFEEQGYQVDLFDKFYANNPAVFDNRYDFITATEVFEHLKQPNVEFQRLLSLLNKGGILAIMTQMLNTEVAFSSWYYRKDPTHICFFSQKTMHYLAQVFEIKIKFYGNNVVLFTV